MCGAAADVGGQTDNDQQAPTKQPKCWIVCQEGEWVFLNCTAELPSHRLICNMRN